jgi:putative 4-mercaptohistidine N1-methyltranferase
MPTQYYESDRAISEYLLFHYGTAEQVLPYSFGPREALHFPVRCVVECLRTDRLPEPARALDLGCAVGRASFELARHCREVVGLDFSRRFVAVASHLQQQGSFTYAYVEEGDLTIPATAVVPVEIDRTRVRFEHGDAEVLPTDLGTFEVVLMANLIDRLQEPKRCLEWLPSLVRPGGQLVVTSPYTWLKEYTPKKHWLGGYEKKGQKIKTAQALQHVLGTAFELAATQDLPFLLREHARKYQWGVAEASLWIRTGSVTMT